MLYRSYATVAALGLLSLSPALTAQDRVTGRDFATRSDVLAKHGMVATSQPLATQAALQVLREGGNAIDAAITANSVLALMEPTGCGLGGDLFAIVWDAESEQLYGLNASGRSPLSLTLDVFKELGLASIPSHGPLPVSVPGCVDGWFELHERFGKLEMPRLLAPAIGYAEEGFPVTDLVAYYWGRSVPALSKWPGFTEQFSIDGRAPAAGELFKNPNLARTLSRIAEGGRDVFYRGEMAHEIAAYMAEHDGYLSFEDLDQHRSEWVEPVSVPYRGVELWELPPNGQGIAALQILRLIEPFDVGAMGFGSADWLHLFTEAKKLAFEDRAHYYADPSMADVPTERMISAEYADERRELLSMKRAARRVAAGDPFGRDDARLERGDTIYLATADEAGNMVSLIQSNYRGMGSGMAPANLGFILQDRGELFDLEPGRANSYAPGKRPFHTIIPAFVTRDGQPWIAYGVMGGATQPQAHVQVLCNIVDFGMGLQEAGDAARLVHTGSSEPTGERMDDGGKVNLERGLTDWEVVRELMRRGHNVGFANGIYGGYQAVMRDPENGVLHGASESRKDGQAAGF